MKILRIKHHMSDIYLLVVLIARTGHIVTFLVTDDNLDPVHLVFPQSNMTAIQSQH